MMAELSSGKTYLLLLLTIFGQALAVAQWSTDPNYNLVVAYGLNPNVCSDGNGGCYVTYEQGSYPRSLLIERLNRYGYKTWGNRIQIAGELSVQASPVIIPDGGNGAFIAYNDVEIDGRYYVRVQRIDSTGVLLYGATGIRATISESYQDYQSIVASDSGRCIVAWPELDGSIYANMISTSGQRMWGDSGIYIGNDPFGDELEMVSDGNGGAIIVWSGMKYQRLNVAGTKLWGDTGLVWRGLAQRAVVSDGQGGVIVGGMKYLGIINGGSIWDATCQRFDSTGSTAWGDSGIILDDSVQNIVTSPPYLTAEMNSQGSVLFAWVKRSADSSYLIGLAQYVTLNGEIVFIDSAHSVTASDTSHAGTARIVRSTNNSMILINSDSRYGGSKWGQLMDSLGNLLWPPGDVLLSTRHLSPFGATDDRNGGAIIVGFDQGDFSIRAQQVSGGGILGDVVTSVDDPGFGVSEKFYLLANYPNPFNSSTIITVDIPFTSHLSVRIYNTLGENVDELLDGTVTAGRHSLTWIAANLPSGVYLCEVRGEYYRRSLNLILLR